MQINNNEYFTVLEDIKSRIKTTQYKTVLYMRRFAALNRDFQKVQQGVALLPWRNNLTLLAKVKDEC